MRGTFSLFLLLLFFNTELKAVKVTSEGFASFPSKNDLRKAELDASERALIRYLGNRLSPIFLIRSYGDVRSTFLENVEKYVEIEKVVDKKVESGILIAKLFVNIRDDLVESSISRLFFGEKMRGGRSAFVMISERDGNGMWRCMTTGSSDSSVSKDEILRELKIQGYEAIPYPDGIDNPALSECPALFLSGDEFSLPLSSPEIVFSGKSWISEGAHLFPVGKFSMRATLVLEVLDLNSSKAAVVTGRGSFLGDDPVSAGREAMKKATRRAIESVFFELHGKGDEIPEDMVYVEFFGKGGKSSQFRFEKFLRQSAGTDRVLHLAESGKWALYIVSSPGGEGTLGSHLKRGGYRVCQKQKRTVVTEQHSKGD